MFYYNKIQQNTCIEHIHTACTRDFFSFLVGREPNGEHALPSEGRLRTFLLSLPSAVDNCTTF